MKFLRKYNENSDDIHTWEIYAGLGGGFNSMDLVDDNFIGTEDEAEKYAWESACEVYESHVGLHGLRTLDEIMEEDDVSEEEAEEIYNEERESWLDYKVVRKK